MGAPVEHELIARIYEAAFEADLWPDVLERIAEQIGARHIFLGIHDVINGAQSIAPRTDPAHLEDYNRHWVDKNPCVAAMIAAPVGHVFHTPGEVADGQAYRRSEIFNEWCRPGDMGYGAMCVALRRSPRQHAFSSAYKSWGVDGFEDDERQLYSRLVDHLSRALDLQRRVIDLRNVQAAANGALASVDEGILATDREGRVLFKGGGAGEIFARMGSIVEIGSLLPPPFGSGRLSELLQSCLDPGRSQIGGVVAIPREGRLDLRMSVLPLPSNQRSQLPIAPELLAAAIIVLADPELKMERMAARLQTLYGLTPAEVRFAMEIARGDGKKLAATRCGISYATARAHLSSIFEKTGVHRQAELVRVLIGG